MEQLNIVIIGSSALPELEFKDPLVTNFGLGSIGQTPSLENYLEAKSICRDKNIDLKVFLIDPNYNAVVNYTNVTSKILQDEYDLLTSLQINGVEVIPLHFHKWDNYLSKSGKDIPMIKQLLKSPLKSSPLKSSPLKSSDNSDEISLNENIIYVSYVGSSITNSYEFMTFLETSRTDNRWYHIPEINQRCNVSKIVNDFINEDNTIIINPYNIYTGDAVSESITDNDLQAAKSYLSIGCILAVQYLNAGFSSYEADLPLIILDNWFYQCETPFLKGIILYYGLYSESADKSTRSEILTSAASRRTITFTICKVLSNFAINNNIISIEEASEVGGWLTPSIYEIIYNRLDNWLV